MSPVNSEAPYACMSSFWDCDASASSGYWRIRRLELLRDILRAILLSKFTCFEVHQNNYKSHVNQTCLPIYGTTCDPLSLIQSLEWHLNSKIQNISIWLQIPATSIRMTVVRLPGLPESNHFCLFLFTYHVFIHAYHYLMTLISLVS